MAIYRNAMALRRLFLKRKCRKDGEGVRETLAQMRPGYRYSSGFWMSKSEDFAQSRHRNIQLFAVFGNGAPGDVVPLVAEHDL